MNLTWLDWCIVAAVLLFMGSSVHFGRRRMQSVADFLAAGRTAGRYLLSVASGVAGLGAITIVGLLEMNYVAGFSMSWWGLTMGVVILIMTASGWVIYRFRETRSLTLAEFFERRYSRRFRVFAGIVAFGSGIINFGIFPSVGARFFIHFCGLPPELHLLGLTVPMFPLVMIMLLSIALFFVFSGGQITILIADFIQGVFVNVVFIVLVLFLLTQIEWNQILEALQMAPENASLINPFKTGHVEDFNLVYFLIGIFGVFYGAMSWQGTQGYNTSAKSAHEAKMAAMLSNWRNFPQNLFLLIVPIIAYTVLHHPDFAAIAEHVRAVVGGIDNEAVQSQLRTPIVLTHLLGMGLMGAFAAVMLAAFISTHDTYLHSWGSIFIQDIVMPFRKTALSSRQHLRVLRLSILGVAVFIFFFSLLFQQSEYIFLFFAITGAIFAGGSGAVIIGGLYWKRGTTAAAWSAMLAGSAIAVGGILIHQLPESLFTVSRDSAPAFERSFWNAFEWLYHINGQQYWAVAMFVSSLLYVVVSLAGRGKPADLDRLLHRGIHSTEENHEILRLAPGRGWRILGMGREFSRGDRVIFIVTYAWTVLSTLVFVMGTIYNLSHEQAEPGGVPLPAAVESEVAELSGWVDEGRFVEAETRLSDLLAVVPPEGETRVRRQLGLCYLGQKRFDDASEALEAVVARTPAWGQAWSELSKAAYGAGDIERSQYAAEMGRIHLDRMSRLWSRYWYVYVVIQVALSSLVVLWFSLGGVRDIRRMLSRLDRLRRDVTDDGQVHGS